MLVLQGCKRTHPLILQNMSVHYSQPKGFVGRNICYLILFADKHYGSIVGGSATLYLPNRNEYFGIDSSSLNNIINNIFYHIEHIGGKYPCRNFAIQILKSFREKIALDWKNKYGDEVFGFESLVELPRTGEVYKRDKWDLIGQTIGYTCKRVGGSGTDSWSGKRVWNTKELKPKLVFVKKMEKLK